LLREYAHDWTRIWRRTAIRPIELPARICTLAGEIVAMPQVPDHEIRIIGVHAMDATSLRLDVAGAAVTG
jgi:hypothetical protein